MKKIVIATVLCVLALTMTGWAEAEPGPLQVFVLVGQSNMQGAGRLVNLDGLIADWRTLPEFGHLKSGGNWTEFDDVWIKYWDQKGNLKAGYGHPGIGPELGFGYVVGSAHENQVLLIKVAWGGQSLGRDFRPPSSGTSDEKLKAVLSKTNEKNRKKNRPEVTVEQFREGCGVRYRELIEEVKTVLGDITAVFPDYDADKGYTLAGMVWFQGWNDHINADFADEYEVNMANFIRDVRKDLGVPKLPFVIGEFGPGGVEVDPRWAAKHYKIRDGQKGAANLPEFKGTTAYARTAHFVDAAAGKQGYDAGYHYGGRADTFYRMGDAFGRAMLGLLGKSPVSTMDKATVARVKAIREIAESKGVKAVAELLSVACSEKLPLPRSVAVSAFVERSLESSDRTPDDVAGLYEKALQAAVGVDDTLILLRGLGRVYSPKAMTMMQSYLADEALVSEASRSIVEMAGGLVIDHPAVVKPIMEKIAQGTAAPAVKAKAALILKHLNSPNLVRMATISNPEGYKQTHRGRGPGIEVAIDGDLESRWIPEEGKDLYRVWLEFDRPREAARLRIVGYRGNRYAPKDFDIVCDGKVVKEVRGASHVNGAITVDFPPTTCKSLQLNITGYYAGSPGMRELEVYGRASEDQ